jgi:16S rRNA (guanine966-N2)-methyltransferase
MRIIAGNLRGQRLYAPKGRKTRPTSDRVREAIFNILGEISEIKVLDLFAGSGALSLEALSRGAQKAVLVDNSSEAKDIILKNAANLHLTEKIKLINLPVERGIKKLAGTESFDIIFADPPYSIEVDQAENLIYKIRDLSLLSKEGIIIFEISSKKDLKKMPFKIINEKKYGDTKVYFLKNE